MFLQFKVVIVRPKFRSFLGFSVFVCKWFRKKPNQNELLSLWLKFVFWLFHLFDFCEFLADLKNLKTSVCCHRFKSCFFTFQNVASVLASSFQKN